MAFLLSGCPGADRPYQFARVEFMQACRKDTHCYSELHATTLNQVGLDYNTMKLQYVRPHHASGGGGREVAGPIEESIG
jgi:hypothetical protein